MSRQLVRGPPDDRLGAFWCECFERDPLGSFLAGSGRDPGQTAGRRPPLGPDRGAGWLSFGRGGTEAGCDAGRVADLAVRARPSGGHRHLVAVLRAPRDQLQKKPRTPPSRTDLTSRRAGRPGWSSNPISIPAGWCSSMRPEPRPRWPACVAAQSVVNAAVPRSRMDIGRQPPSPPVCAWMA